MCFCSFFGCESGDPMAPRPDPRRGEYWRSRVGSTNIVCRAYTVPPSVGLGTPGEESIWTYPAGSYLGPVHGVEKTVRFVSIQVPGPLGWNQLVWINVWRRRRRRAADTGTGGRVRRSEPEGVNYAVKVPYSVVRAWRSAGWEDRFFYFRTV